MAFKMPNKKSGTEDPEENLVWLGNHFRGNESSLLRATAKTAGCKIYMRKPRVCTELLSIQDLLWAGVCGFYCDKKDLKRVYKALPRYKRLHERLHSRREAG